MLCLSFINSVIRKLRQIKTQPSYRRDNNLHRNCNLTLPCQSHIYQQSVTAASYSFFMIRLGFSEIYYIPRWVAAKISPEYAQVSLLPGYHHIGNMEKRST